jgi:hypothetical protein
MHQGSCHCGAVRYEVHGDLGAYGCCHCRSCQKATGSAFSANAPVDRERFVLLSGDETLREYASSPGMIRVFCSRCGSPIYAYRQTASDVVRIRLGSLDTPFDRGPRVHTFVGEKAPWETVANDAPHFEERADPSAIDRRDR